MKNKGTQFLAEAAVIGAIYVVLTLLFAPLSYGEIQIRFSEALTILPFFTPAAIPGLFVGCIIANLFGGAIPVDIILRVEGFEQSAIEVYHFSEVRSMSLIRVLLTFSSYRRICICIGVGSSVIFI